jgi:5,10-methylenetetrahydromethanopterin reductase
LPEVIQDTIARIHAGASAAARTPSDVDIWFTTRSSLHEDRVKALQNAKASVSSILNHSMRQTLEGKNVPDGLRAKLHEYVEKYVLYDHVLSSGDNPKRMDELGLTDYAMRRFALAGNPNDWIARIEELATSGATKLWLNAEGGKLERQLHYMRTMGDQGMSAAVLELSSSLIVI